MGKKQIETDNCRTCGQCHVQIRKRECLTPPGVGRASSKMRELWRVSRKQAEKEGKRILGKGSKVFRGPEL